MTSQTTHAVQTQLDADFRAEKAKHGVARGVIRGLPGAGKGLASSAFSRYKSSYSYQSRFAHDHIFCPNKVGDTYVGTGARKIEFEVESGENYGDLIDSMYLVTSWPGVDLENLPSDMAGSMVTYLWGLGYQSFRYVDLTVGNGVRLRMSSAYMELLSELRPSTPNKGPAHPDGSHPRLPSVAIEELLSPPGARMREMVFKWDDVSWHNMAERSKRPFVLYTRLPFFFSESPGAALPYNALSLSQGKIFVTVEMSSIEECVAIVPDQLVKWHGAQDAAPTNLDFNTLQVELLVGWVSLDDDEGDYFARSSHNFMVRQIYTPMGNVTEKPIRFPEGSDTLVLHQNALRHHITSMHFAIADANRGLLRPPGVLTSGDLTPYKGGVRASLGGVMSDTNLTSLEPGCTGQYVLKSYCQPPDDRLKVETVPPNDDDDAVFGLAWSAMQKRVPTFILTGALEDVTLNIRQLKVTVGQAVDMKTTNDDSPTMTMYFGRESVVMDSEGVLDLENQGKWFKGLTPIEVSSTEKTYMFDFDFSYASASHSDVVGGGLVAIIGPSTWGDLGGDLVKFSRVGFGVEQVYTHDNFRPQNLQMVVTTSNNDGKTRISALLGGNLSTTMDIHIPPGSIVSDEGVPLNEDVVVTVNLSHLNLYEHPDPNVTFDDITVSPTEYTRVTLSFSPNQMNSTGFKGSMITLTPANGEINDELLDIHVVQLYPSHDYILMDTNRKTGIAYTPRISTGLYVPKSFTFQFSTNSNTPSIASDGGLYAIKVFDGDESFFLEEDAVVFNLNLNDLPENVNDSAFSYPGLMPPSTHDFSEMKNDDENGNNLKFELVPVDSDGVELQEDASNAGIYSILAIGTLFITSVHECEKIVTPPVTFAADVAKYRADRGTGPWLPKNSFDYRMCDDQGNDLEPLKSLQMRLNGEKYWEDPMCGEYFRNLTMYEKFAHPEVRKGIYSLTFADSAVLPHTFVGCANMSAFALKEFEFVASRESTAEHPLELLVWMEHWIVLTLSNGTMRESTFKAPLTMGNSPDKSGLIVMS